MSTTHWPLPVTGETDWRDVYAVAVDRPVTLRPARLWGRAVLIDASGDVFCDGCGNVLAPGDLAQPGNGHRPFPKGLHALTGRRGVSS